MYLYKYVYVFECWFGIYMVKIEKILNNIKGLYE